MDTNIIFQILGKISAAIGSTSLTLTEKKMDSESPPQHYRQRDNWNDGDLQPKPLFIQHHLYQSQPRSEENGKNPKPLEVYSNADLSTVQSFGTLPRRYKKSSSSSANSSFSSGSMMFHTILVFVVAIFTSALVTDGQIVENLIQ